MSFQSPMRACKLIVLDQTIKSMTLFKQIIGRGTRIDEDNNKFFFTIMDFKRATALFRDDAFDGAPVVIYEPDDDDDPVPPDPEEPEEDDADDDDNGGATKIVISGVTARIIAERIEYIGSDGKLITESYREYARKAITSEFRSLDEFIRRWNDADRKQAIIDELEEHGVVLANLQEVVGRDVGDFDLLAHIAYDQPPLTRRDRADKVKKRNYFAKYGEKARAVLEALLDKYADEGIATIEDTKVLRLKPFNGIGTPLEIIKGAFGGKAGYDAALSELEHQIYGRVSNE